MNQTVNRASPTLGMALGYFIILWAVLNGHISESHQPEAVAMAGVVVTNVIMEIKGFGRWLAGFWSKKDEEV